MLGLTISFTFTLIVICNGHDNRAAGAFDQIVLVQGYPITAFWTLQKEWPIKNYRPLNSNITHGAWDSLENPYFWILHGLWPSKNNRNHPKFCYVDEINSASMLINSPLKARLSRRWPSYHLNKTEDQLWDFAWRKHGSCMTNLLPTKNLLQYFDKATDLLRRHNLGPILKNNKIDPGQSYDLNFIKSAVRRKLNIDPNLRCVVDEASLTKEQYLAEASVCMNRAFQVKECVIPPRPTCDSNRNVTIPELKEISISELQKLNDAEPRPDNSPEPQEAEGLSHSQAAPNVPPTI